MHIISKPQVNRAIKQLVYKEVENKEGVLYKTIPPEEELFMEQFLNRFYYALSSFFNDKNKVSEIFIERLSTIDAIRFNNKDEQLMPLKLAFDEMKETCQGNLEGGLFMPAINQGVVVLDMDFMNLSKKEAVHTLIHELIHAISTFRIKEEGREIYKSGFTGNGKAFYRLNEGVVEYISQLMWKKMYPTKSCPGVGRYNLEVEAAKLVMGRFASVGNFIEDYITNTASLENQLKEMKNENGKSLFDFIKSFNEKDFGDVKIQKRFVVGVETFKDKNIEI